MDKVRCGSTGVRSFDHPNLSLQARDWRDLCGQRDSRRSELFDDYLPVRWLPHLTGAVQDLWPGFFQGANLELEAYSPFFRQTRFAMRVVQLRLDAPRAGLMEHWPPGG